MFWKVAVFGVAMASAAASAQTSPKAGSTPAAASVSDDTKAAARKRYDKGRAYEKAGKPDLAYNEYAAAYKLYSHWQIAGALGTLALQRGLHREAAERLSQFLREAEGLDNAEREEKKKLLAEAMTKVGTLSIETATGAEIFVDGNLEGRAPLGRDVFVEPGAHQIEAKKAGESAKAGVDAGMGKREPVKLRFGPVSDTPAATATVPIGPSGPATSSVAPRATASSTLLPGDAASSGSVAPLVAGGAVALAAVGIGVGLFAVSADNRMQAIRQLAILKEAGPVPNNCKTADCKAIGDRLRQYDTLLTGAAGAWIGAGVAAALGLTIWAVGRQPNKTSTVVVVNVTGGGPRISLQGSW